MKSGISTNAQGTKTIGTRFAARAFVTTAVAASFIGIAGVPAFAAPGITDDGDTTANVVVQSAIALTALTSDFTLTGVPGATVVGLGAVTMNVETNNQAGYAVTVEAAATELVPANPVTNPDEIPIGALGVRETAVGNAGAYTPLSATTPVTTHTQNTRSAEDGDTISNDYRIAIPFVNEDTYSATLNYVATTL